MRGDQAKINDAAKKAIIVQSGNMSLGVNLLAALTKRVAQTLDQSFDIEILEMHHNQKIDAPSGTALLLGRAAAEGRGVDLDEYSLDRWPRRQAQAGRHRLCLACAAAPWSASTASSSPAPPSASSSRTAPRTA